MSLSITRTPTLYSLSQMEDERKNPPSQAVKEEILESSELPLRKIMGDTLPMYRYCEKSRNAKKIRSFGNFGDLLVPDVDNLESVVPASSGELSQESSDSGQVVPQQSLMDNLLLAEWDDRAEKGLFRYDVTACPTHIIEGSHGFISQLNEGRASKKRPTEFRVDKVDQPFDESKFNFCKAFKKEALFQFEQGASGEACFEEEAEVKSSPNLVLINVSPIEYGHVLLVPRALDNMQQLVTPDTFLLALRFAQEANNPYFRIGFNSLGAYATVNHLHFQAYYLASPMPLERAMTSLITRRSGRKGSKSPISIHKLENYPVKGLVFEAGDSLEDMANLIGGLCQRLSVKNIPHNIMVVDRGARVFLIPNSFSARKARNELPEDVIESQVDPAVFEISGHIVLKRKEDYEKADQEWVWKLLECASVSDEKFDEVVDLCLI